MISFRVDDFPYTKADETWRHNLDNFKLFNELMKKYRANYVLGVIPDRVSFNMLKYLTEEQEMIEVALHGIHHDERFLNEFREYETEDEIYHSLMSAKYPFDRMCGPVTTYIPPHNVVDRKTVNALVRAGFKTLFGGPETDREVMRYAHEQKGMDVHSHFAPHYGRTDEMMQRGYIPYVKWKSKEQDIMIGLHWTWEWNIGLQSLETFLDGIREEIMVGRG